VREKPREMKRRRGEGKRVGDEEARGRECGR
jgi:hypothetical protein